MGIQKGKEMEEKFREEDELERKKVAMKAIIVKHYKDVEDEKLREEKNGWSIVEKKKKQPTRKRELEIKCQDCRCVFDITNKEQEWYKSKNYELPKRCKGCRKARKRV